MSKYLIRLTKTEELTATVHADTQAQAEALALDEVMGLEWNNTKLRVRSTRNLTVNEIPTAISSDL